MRKEANSGLDRTFSSPQTHHSIALSKESTKRWSIYPRRLNAKRGSFGKSRGIAAKRNIDEKINAPINECDSRFRELIPNTSEKNRRTSGKKEKKTKTAADATMAPKEIVSIRSIKITGDENKVRNDVEIADADMWR